MVSPMITPRYAEDVAYFLSISLYKFVNELESSNAPYVRGLAMHLGLPTRYDNGAKKTMAVLAAGIFTQIREMKGVAR